MVLSWVPKRARARLQGGRGGGREGKETRERASEGAREGDRASTRCSRQPPRAARAPALRPGRSRRREGGRDHREPAAPPPSAARAPARAAPTMHRTMARPPPLRGPERAWRSPSAARPAARGPERGECRRLGPGGGGAGRGGAGRGGRRPPRLRGPPRRLPTFPARAPGTRTWPRADPDPLPWLRSSVWGAGSGARKAKNRKPAGPPSFGRPGGTPPPPPIPPQRLRSLDNACLARPPFPEARAWGTPISLCLHLLPSLDLDTPPPSHLKPLPGGSRPPHPPTFISQSYGLPFFSSLYFSTLA